MAQVYQPHMGYQRAGKFSERQLILVAHSNAIGGLSGASFAELPVTVKEFLGIKKALCQAQHGGTFTKKEYIRSITQNGHLQIK